MTQRDRWLTGESGLGDTAAGKLWALRNHPKVAPAPPSLLTESAENQGTGSSWGCWHHTPRGSRRQTVTALKGEALAVRPGQRKRGRSVPCSRRLRNPRSHTPRGYISIPKGPEKKKHPTRPKLEEAWDPSPGERPPMGEAAWPGPAHSPPPALSWGATLHSIPLTFM